MKSELKNFVWIFILGAGLVTYANSNFATRGEFKMLIDSVKVIDKKLDQLILRSLGARKHNDD